MRKMEFTYYGHSCFMIETGGKKLLFDPFISPNPMAEQIDMDEIEADFILVSHGHEDHVADLVKLALKTGAVVICAWEIMLWLKDHGVTNVHPMNTGGKFNFDFGTVRCTVAHHSSTMPDGSDGGNPMGFLVETPESRFYYSGDTALTLDMQLIPRWGSPDFGIMPVGGNFTMDAADAAIAATFAGTKKVIGVHYDTFGYIVIDHEAAKKTFEGLGLTLLLPEIGTTIPV